MLRKGGGDVINGEIYGLKTQNQLPHRMGSFSLHGIRQGGWLMGLKGRHFSGNVLAILNVRPLSFLTSEQVDMPNS